MSDKNDSRASNEKGFIWISENCSPSSCDIQAYYYSLAASVMVMGPEILAQNKDSIRVDSTRVRGTLVWNLANTSLFEHGASIALVL